MKKTDCRASHALLLMQERLTPLSKLWNTFYLLSVNTEEYHKSPEVLFEKEAASEANVLLWYKYVWAAIAAILFFFSAAEKSSVSFIFKFLEESGFHILPPVNLLFEVGLTTTFGFAMAFFVPYLLAETICRKCLRKRDLSIRFYRSAALLYITYLVMLSFVTWVYSVLSHIVSLPDGSIWQRIAAAVPVAVSGYFLFYLVPRHLSYRYHIALYKAMAVLSIGPMFLMMVFAVLFYGYAFYLLGVCCKYLLLVLCVPLWPHAFRRTRHRVGKYGWKSLLCAVKQDWEPSLGHKMNLVWALVAIAVVGVIAEMVQRHGKNAIADSEARLPEGHPTVSLSVFDTDDPIEHGYPAEYVIMAHNSGSSPVTNIRVTCSLSENGEFLPSLSRVRTKGRIQEKEIYFEPLPCLDPGARASWIVAVRAVSGNDLMFTAKIVADQMAAAIQGAETTHLLQGRHAKPD